MDVSVSNLVVSSGFLISRCTSNQLKCLELYQVYLLSLLERCAASRLLDLANLNDAQLF